jgi:hypothetical protein
MTLRRWLVLALACLLAWLGYRLLAGAGARSEANPRASAPVGRGRAPARFQDGRWVTTGELRPIDRILAQLRWRPAGLVQVAGTVRDHETGSPIPAAEVVFASPLGESTAAADDSGRYEILVRPAAYRTFARADGYTAVGASAPARVPGPPDFAAIGMPKEDLAPVLRVDADREGVDIHLSGAAEIYGTVYNGAGNPVDGVLIVAEKPDRGGTASLVPVLGTHLDETDVNGSYQLTVPAGYVVLTAVHRSYAGADGWPGQHLAPGDRVRVDLTLVAGCIIEGTAVDVEGYRVGEGAFERYFGGPPPNDFAPVARLDENGDFRLALRDDGPVTVRAWPWKSPPAVPQTFACADGAHYRNVRFVTPAAQPDLEGAVLDATGAPVPHAFVDILPLEAGGGAQQERADGYGEWAVYSLPAGPYQVTAYVPGHGVAVALTRAPATRVDLRLSGTGSIAGRVAGITDGAFTMVIDSCRVEMVEGPDASFDDFSMPAIELLVPVTAGAFQVDGLPACWISGRAAAATDFDYFHVRIEPGRTIPVELSLGGGDFVGNTPPPG